MTKGKITVTLLYLYATGVAASIHAVELIPKDVVKKLYLDEIYTPGLIGILR